MRTRLFRFAALALGALGIPSLAAQVWRGWPPTEAAWLFFGTQAAVLFAFLSFGAGRGPLAMAPPAGDPPASDDAFYDPAEVKPPD